MVLTYGIKLEQFRSLDAPPTIGDPAWLDFFLSPDLRSLSFDAQASPIDSPTDGEMSASEGSATWLSHHLPLVDSLETSTSASTLDDVADVGSDEDSSKLAGYGSSEWGPLDGRQDGTIAFGPCAACTEDNRAKRSQDQIVLDCITVHCTTASPGKHESRPQVGCNSSADSDNSVKSNTKSPASKRQSALDKNQKKRQNQKQTFGKLNRHNQIEKRHRDGLNSRFLDLIAALGPIVTNESGCGSPEVGKSRPSKGTVLGLATERIIFLEQENELLKAEAKGLIEVLDTRQRNDTVGCMGRVV